MVTVLPGHVDLLREFTMSSLFKFILTEGEKLIMVGTSSFSVSEQAEYSLVSNLIGLVCKYIFQPAEESAFMFFSAQDKKEVEVDTLRRYL
mgnify:CR=1 FL=1